MIIIKPFSRRIALVWMVFAGLLSNQSMASSVLREQAPPWLASADAPVQSVIQTRSNNSRSQNNSIALQQAAQSGDPRAQLALGMQYYHGQGVPRDIAQSVYWLTYAAQNGEPNAELQLALVYRRGEAGQVDLARSLHWLYEAAQRGQPEAQYQLGDMYWFGKGIQADQEQGFYWLGLAAEQRHPQAIQAMSQLQTAPVPMPEYAQLPPADSAPAMPRPVHNVNPQMVNRPHPTQMPPSTAPLPSALTELGGNEYANIAPSTSLQQQADDAGEEGAKIDLQGMNPHNILQLADTGDRYAQFLIGAMYEDGSNGFEQNYNEAARWYRRSAKQNYAKAQYNLALLYEDGRGVNQDYRQASQWYRAAASGGFTKAKNNLGILYILGKGVRKSSKQAATLFADAAREGNEDAAHNLVRLQQK